MCGLAGEIRFDGSGGRRRRGRAGMRRGWRRRGPDGSGIWADGPVALGHRRLAIIDLSRGRRAADGRRRARADRRLQRLHLQLPAAARRAAPARATVLLALRHRGDRQGLRRVGRWTASSTSRACSPSRSPSATAAASVLARDRLGIKPLYLDQTPRPAALRLDAAGAAGRAAASTPPSTATALAYYMSFHSVVPAPRTILTGVRKLPPATVRVVEPDGTQHATRATGTRRSPATRPRADWSERDWQDALLDALRTAVERRMVADVPVGVLLSGGIDSSLVVALLAEAGQTDLQTFSIGFESAGGESGDEFEYSDLVARALRHRPPPDPDRHRPAAARHRRAPIAAMSEPMVSHDCVAFYLLSRGGVEVGQGGAVRAGRRRGARRLRLVPAAGRRAARATPSRRTPQVFFDRRVRRAAPSCCSPDWLADDDAPTRVHRRRSSPRPAPRPRSTPRCATTPRSCSSTTR